MCGIVLWRLLEWKVAFNTNKYIQLVINITFNKYIIIALNRK
jgi:hypothetical protein